MSIQSENIDVVSGLRQGKNHALTILFDRYFTSLCHFATRLVQDSEDAKDIVLVTFNKLWNSRENFHSEQNIKSFLYIAVKNACFDFLKVNGRRLAHHESFSTLDEINEGDFELRQVETELLRKIYEEAAKLPEKCRKVFELTYLEELNSSEIAQQLNISISNVTSQRARAIQLLKIALLDQDLLFFYFLLLTLNRKV
ncbi:RNA polymerase sigma-70 factor [Pedobacter africanus]|uniref:RNA polymerase sigma-70 factor, ECF subfamily n=1 Tax=Pedobacter africanus TaxID=151894 RepID=A0A1W2CRV2_9SPHI|nr:RNA polymerase sigma-70 factor [Pedobacter africanus]SMC87622.1 RNA polymerase sigma-70 factor, ECF subfamily [Pedobacter africanus]